MEFITVRCPDCNNQQNINERAAMQVTCLVCDTVLATPTGGKAEIVADRV